MKRHTRLVLCSFLAVIFAVAGAQGQACGRYSIKLSVQDAAGNPVNDANIVLKPTGVDETQGQSFTKRIDNPSRFSISFSEGHSFSTFHDLVVSAPGYATATNQVKFLSCANRDIVVRLRRAGSGSAAVWTFENRIQVRIAPAADKSVESVRLYVDDSQNHSEEFPVKYGFAIFDLPNGKYKFRVIAAGFKPYSRDVDLSRLENRSIEVHLEPDKHH